MVSLQTKGMFFKLIYVLFFGLCFESMSMHTNPSCSRIFFSSMSPTSSSCFGMILDKRGGELRGHHVSKRSMVWHSVALALPIIIK